MIFVLSSFLDNIAAALIGGTIAGVVFRGKVHIGYLAAIVAASNAGGSGSVVGDTTTTMMWIDGVSPLCGARGLRRGVGRDGDLRHPRGDAAAAPFADRQGRAADVRIDCVRVFIVARDPGHRDRRQRRHQCANSTTLSDRFPFIGAAVWVALLLCVPLRRPALERVAGRVQGHRSSCCRWCSRRR